MRKLYDLGLDFHLLCQYICVGQHLWIEGQLRFGLRVGTATGGLMVRDVQDAIFAGIEVHLPAEG